MKRANQFNVRPRSEREREVFVRWLDASAALWNETTYARRQAFFTDDETVWDADTGTLEGKYKGILSSSVAQHIIRRNSDAWRSLRACTCRVPETDKQFLETCSDTVFIVVADRTAFQPQRGPVKVDPNRA